MSSRSESRLRWFLAGIALFGLAALAVVVGVYLRSQGLATAVNVAQLVSVALAAAPLAVGSIVWARRGAVGSTLIKDEQLDGAREALANMVRRQWRREEQVRSLGDPYPMPVGWKLTDRPVSDHPWLIAPSRVVVAGRSDRLTPLVQAFNQLNRRRLVVIGGPGSGKTTLAVQLLMRLLATRTPAEPVPVLLTLAGWDITTHPEMWEWIASRLGRDFPALRAFGTEIPRALVDQRMVLPILDGLDELPAAKRPGIIASLNASLGESDPVVVTSRTIDYEATVAASDVLTAAAVIEAEPLAADSAADYLESCLTPQSGQAWHSVIASLRANEIGALAEICSTPLGLWLVRTVYIMGRRDPTPLLDSTEFPDSAVLRSHLFDSLIPAVLAARPPSSDPEDILRPRRLWNHDKMRVWLTFLAEYLGRVQTRDFLWWHLALNTFTRPVFGVGLGLVFGLISGVGFGIVGGLRFGVLGALGFGLASVLVGRLGCSIHMEPRYARLRLPTGQGRALIDALVRSLAFGLVGGLMAGLVFGLVNPPVGALMDGRVKPLVQELSGALAFGLVFGLALALMYTLSEWTQRPIATDSASTPMSTLRLDRTAVLLRLIIPVLVLSTGFGFLLGSVQAGLMFGLLCGLAAWLPASGAWLVYTMAARRLALARRIPWRFQNFLEDCYRLGLLRITGPAYEFRHAEFQDYLVHTGQRTQGRRPATKLTS